MRIDNNPIPSFATWATLGRNDPRFVDPCPFCWSEAGHCGHCPCCNKESAALRGDAMKHPAEVDVAVAALQAELKPGERRVIGWNDTDVPTVITDRMKAGKWRVLRITRKSQMWNML
jgi:hypothetical protein